MSLGKTTYALLLSLFLFALCGCGKSQKQRDIISSLSPQALAAKYYIDNELPESQRHTFYTGKEVYLNDKANLFANLIDSGHLDGAAEYAEAILKQSGNNN